MNEAITQQTHSGLKSQQRFEFGLSLAYALIKVPKVLVTCMGERSEPARSSGKTAQVLALKGTGSSSSLSAEQAYLAHVAEFKRLSADEERTVATRMRAGDEHAKNQLVSANLGLVVMFAKRYSRTSGAALLDLVAEGNIALLQATRTFDPTLGFRFATYAKRPVTQAMVRALPRLSGSVTVPLGKQEAAMSAPIKSTRVHGDGDNLHTSATHAVSSGAYSATVDFGPVPDAAELPADEKHEPSNRVNSVLRQKTLSKALKCLASREQEIMVRRFGLDGEEPATLALLAKKYGISIERVRQIESATLKRLATNLTHSGHDLETLLQIWER